MSCVLEFSGSGLQVWKQDQYWWEAVGTGFGQCQLDFGWVTVGYGGTQDL
jgi:hypothetical protein